MFKGGFNLSLVQKICVLYIIVWSISPPLMVDDIYRLIGVAAAGVWIVIQFIRQRPLEMDTLSLGSVAFLFMVIGVAAVGSGFSTSAMLKQIGIIMLVLCYVMSYFYEGRWDELDGLLEIILILTIYWNIVTLREIWDRADIARLIVRNDAVSIDYLRRGIGGYSLIYPQAVISPAVFAWTFYSRNHSKIDFIIGLVWSVTIILYAFKANYAIALFTVILGLVILLFYRRKHIAGAVIIATVVFGAIMAAIYYWEGFRNWLLRIFEGTAVAHKIEDLVAVNDPEDKSANSISARVDRYLYSLKLIANYPIVGTLWRGETAGHSAIVDTAAQYGLLGAFFYNRMFFSVPIYFKKHFGDKSKTITIATNACMVVCLFVAALDSVTYPFMAFVLLVMPLALDKITRWSGAYI